MMGGWRSAAVRPSEVLQTLAFRGRRSRNKVSVGEPAEGSLHSIGPTTAKPFNVFAASAIRWQHNTHAELDHSA